jgi:hypothetical protein
VAEAEGTTEVVIAVAGIPPAVGAHSVGGKMTLGKRFVFLALLAFSSMGAETGLASDAMVRFQNLAEAPKLDEHIQREIQLPNESYYVHKPANYTGSEPFGLIVYIDPENQITKTPPGWDRVLEQRKFLFISPERSGNDQPIDRRLGLAVLGALSAEREYKIDPSRVYAAGYSGGARMAGLLGFFASDVFHGTIQCGGADFYHAVPQVQGKPLEQDAGTAYGLFDASAEEVAAAKTNVRFVIITGSKDFRHGNLTDIFAGGFEKELFAAKLIDIPEMGHVPCRPGTLKQAIDFIEPTSPASTSDVAAAAIQPVAPPWMSQDPSHWPQILLTNDAKLMDNTAISGASGFLMRLPNGIVLAATAKHLLGTDAKLQDYNSKVKTWFMHPPLLPGNRVRLEKLAEKLPEADALDWMVMAPSSQSGPWPGETLPVRQDELETGDTVYLLAVHYDDKSRQNVYKGTVTDVQPSGEFNYKLEPAQDSQGFSGAPILDAQGQIAGVHSGHLIGEPGNYSGIETTAVLGLLQPPKEAFAATQSAYQTRMKPTTRPAPLNSREADAESALQHVKIYMDNKAYNIAKEKLQQIITTYPDTATATKAEKMLNDVPNQ